MAVTKGSAKIKKPDASSGTMISVSLLAGGERYRIFHGFEHFVVVPCFGTAHEDELAAWQILLFANPFNVHAMAVHCSVPRKFGEACAK